MAGQLEELMSNYGEVCEVWFDGGWDKPADMWDIPRRYDIIKKHNPYCAVGVNGTIGVKDDDGSGFVSILPDMQIEDNKYYMRYFPGDFRLWDPKIAAKRDHKQYLTHVDDGSYYLPFEHTICLSKEWNWFQKMPAKCVRDLDELEELFYWTTSGGNSLVINVPPDRTGRIREHEAQAVIALRNRLGIEYGKPLPTGGRYLQVGCPTEASSTWDGSDECSAAQATDGGLQTRWASKEHTPTLTLTLNPEESFNKLTIFEYCDTEQMGDFSNRRINRIESYKIDRLTLDGEWETIYVSDEPMGDCKTIRFPYPYKASKLRLQVLKARDFPSIYEFNVIADKI